MNACESGSDNVACLQYVGCGLSLLEFLCVQLVGTEKWRLSMMVTIWFATAGQLSFHKVYNILVSYFPMLTIRSAHFVGGPGSL